MKKITLLICGVALFGIFGSNNVKAQAVDQGTLIVDPYYGFPLMDPWYALFDAIGKDSSNAETSFGSNSLGPLGGRAEFMLASRFGMGVDFIYTQYTASWNGNTGYKYELSSNRIRIQARFNYHLAASTEDLDLYFGLGTGTNIRTWTAKTDDPDGYDYSGDLPSIPVSLRMAFGVRYYFSEHIGLSSEIGLGGPIMSLGVSVKF